MTRNTQKANKSGFKTQSVYISQEKGNLVQIELVSRACPSCVIFGIFGTKSCDVKRHIPSPHLVVPKTLLNTGSQQLGFKSQTGLPTGYDKKETQEAPQMGKMCTVSRVERDLAKWYLFRGPGSTSPLCASSPKNLVAWYSAILRYYSCYTQL